VKYIQITVSDELHQRPKKTCIDEKVTLNTKLQQIITSELQHEEDDR
jgi:hypothetical protein